MPTTPQPCDQGDNAQIERQLRESEERLRLSLYAANQGLYDLNVQTGAAIVNREYAEMLGYDPDTFVESNAAWIARLHPDDQELTAKAYRDYISGLVPEYRVEFRQRTAQGGWKWILSLGKIVEYDSAGQPLRMLGTHTDITQRKHAEEALRVSEQRYRTLFEHMLDGYAYCKMLFDTEGRPYEFIYLAVNSAFERLTGLHNVAGRPVSEIIPGIRETNPELFEIYGRVALHGQPERFETYLPALEIWFSVAVYSPEPEHFVAVFENITERKQAEAALHRTLDELARSNADLEQFAYIASHDLQEPLRAVVGMVQLLQQRYRGQLDSRADEYITHAVDAALRMQQLINALLTYSRLGGRPIRQERTSAAEALQFALHNLSVAIHESGARVTYGELPAVAIERTRLVQLFQNLISNSIKFRSAQPPEITISAERLPNAWRFAIRDNGLGIQPQYFERIFAVFQRLHTSREYPGTGIGLAICKKIVEQQGGTIRVESQPGQGTVFFFTIPEPSE